MISEFEEQKLAELFLERGHVVLPTENLPGLEKIQKHVADIASLHLGIKISGTPIDFLNHIHKIIAVNELNAMRLAVFNGLNSQPWFQSTYFSLARSALESLVGNELCIQRKVNLSVQLPGDDSSLLPVHSDVWDGDSPFEVVLWVPMVDCAKTKAMYLMPPEKDRIVQRDLEKFNKSSAEDIFLSIADDVVFTGVKFGEIMIFSQTLMHGNRVNQESETRWSMNCRFKSVMSPYADKKFGEFFEPIKLRAATRLGLDYKLPGGFNG